MCIFAYNSEFAIVKVLSITQAPAICGTTFTHREQYNMELRYTYNYILILLKIL